MLQVTNLRKTYALEHGGVLAVRDVSFEVPEGQIFTLLGPSGCGKSTTLRCVAGLEAPDAGRIVLGEQAVFNSDEQINVPTHKRDVGMVFQSYAIWPHMTVFDNVAFPLRHGPYKLDKAAIHDRVMQALRLVQMDRLAQRESPLLSGGQQQRVALARALVYEPAVLLLDEPLSNLDAKLRLEMRTELRELIKHLHMTTLYVTHDQEEALALSDRIAVMHEGEIQQESDPQALYARPANPRVAAFLGRTNFFAGTVRDAQEEGAIVDCSFGPVACDVAPGSRVLRRDEQVWVTVRPEDVILHAAPPDGLSNAFDASVAQATFVGSRAQYKLQLADVSCEAEGEGRSPIPAGTRVTVQLLPDRVRLFPRAPAQDLNSSPL